MRDYDTSLGAERENEFAMTRTEARPLAPATALSLSIETQTRKNPALTGKAGFGAGAGDGLLSHEGCFAVPSTLTGLTAVFGMGTGVAPSR
jgi:hypothetical protein